jgi:hypothetical protein
VMRVSEPSEACLRRMFGTLRLTPPPPPASARMMYRSSGKVETVPDGNPSPMNRSGAVESVAFDVAVDVGLESDVESEKDVLEEVTFVVVVESETAEARVFGPAELDPRSVLVLVLDARLAGATEARVAVELLSETDDVAVLLNELVTVVRLSSEFDGIETPVNVVWIETLPALVDNAIVPK